MHVQISNVGPNDELIIAPVLRPKDGSLCHPTKTHGEWAVTGRLRPHLYPKHDRPIMIVLEALSKALMADELSELKLPSGKMRVGACNRGSAPHFCHSAQQLHAALRFLKPSDCQPSPAAPPRRAKVARCHPRPASAALITAVTGSH